MINYRHSGSFDRYTAMSIVALLSAYQECLVTFKLMTSQASQRVVGSERVNSPRGGLSANH